MKLIVGLGNPGYKFEGTRHNIGFLVTDELRVKISNSQFPIFNQFSNAQFKYSEKFKSETLKTDDIILAKPQTFMNNSGTAVNFLATYHKLPATNIYIIHDDLDIVLGKYKIQLGIGPKDHNGINDIYQKLGTKDFWHIRIGVENRGDKNIAGEDYVLMKFAQDETITIRKVVGEVVKELIETINDKDR